MIESSVELLFDMSRLVALVAGPALLIGSVSLLELKQWRNATILAMCGVIALLAVGVHLDVLERVTHLDRVPGFVIDLACLVGLHLILGIALTIFFLPSIVACRWESPNRETILLKNVLVGWLPLAWNVILYSAFADGLSAQRQREPQPCPQPHSDR